MGFFDIPELNVAQKSGGKGWNPANGVPFCARAYICRPRPPGAGWVALRCRGVPRTPLVPFDAGTVPHLSPREARKSTPLQPFQNQHSVLLQLLEDIGRPAEGNSSCFSPARGESMLFRLPVAS